MNVISQIYYLSIVEAGKLIAARQLSPVEFVTEFLRRIEDLDKHINSYILVTADRALAEARTAEIDLMAGRYRGPLHGIPFGLKDVYATAGIATTGNSKAFIHNVPTEDAGVVRMLNDSGAILLGKLATHELTYGGVSLDLPWPPARNPWNTDHDTGGSSTGSGAAVAAGLCTMALGTDTGGSVRNPAALCGVVGLKPTYGRVSRHGVIMNSYSLDACGPLTRTVEDCAIVLEHIAGHDPTDPSSTKIPVDRYTAYLGRGVNGVRIGVVRHFYELDLPASEEVRTAINAALRVFESLGAKLDEVRLAPLGEYAACKVTIQQPEIYAVHRKMLEERPQDFGAKFLRRILPGAEVAAVDYVEAQDRRRRLTSQMIAAMGRFDVLVTSGPYGPAPLLSDVAGEAQLNKPEITVPFSLTGHPAISVCCGFSASGLPLGLQIIGRPFDEATVLRVAHAYEQVTSWHTRHPIS